VKKKLEVTKNPTAAVRALLRLLFIKITINGKVGNKPKISKTKGGIIKNACRPIKAITTKMIKLKYRIFLFVRIKKL
jgi:hypothetical protein